MEIDGHHERLMDQLGSNASGPIRVQAYHNLDFRRIFVTLQKELEYTASRTANDAANTANLRSQNVILKEGLNVVASMVKTGKLFSESKHAQLQIVTTINLPKTKGGKGRHQNGFDLFREACEFCEITSGITARDYSKPLSVITNKDFVHFHQLPQENRIKAIRRAERSARAN